MPYIEYLNRVEAILSIVFQIIAFGSMSHLLYKFHRRQLKVKKLATTILIYLITHVIGFIVSVPSIIYEVFFLLQVLPKPTPLQIFWFDVALVVYFFVTPLPIFFLAIDRSFALKFPISHRQWIQRWLSRSAVVFILLWTVVEFGLLMLELPIDEIAICSFYFLYALRMGTSGNLITTSTLTHLLVSLLGQYYEYTSRNFFVAKKRASIFKV
ncbi:hypothetical protein DdX_18862 [Ditylenchus destructor]|uniref:Uncharacterized protein n=1 Tax=Ditylenchus destructor TaxID=166010 RepID=A0AAD4MLH7_9BILA|nr:hypothetical protein DdX_18862 [Ditylenchus destructor]